MKLNCVIIDDEPLAANLLESYAERTSYIHLVGAFNNAVDGMKAIRENSVDLVFMDIQMPDLNGIEFAKILPKSVKVIFTTAFSQYAIKGYDVNALGYLLKPISYEDFLKATAKALDYFTERDRDTPMPADRFIFMKSEYKLLQIPLDDILYIEGVKDYVKVYMAGDKKPVMSLMNMKKLEDYLPHPEFLRVHRSYIVHMTRIELIDRLRIVFGDKFIPVSESYKGEVQKYLDQHTLM